MSRLESDGYEPDEIEITDAMIAAGIRALDLCRASYPDFLLVKEVYTAMERERVLSS